MSIRNLELSFAKLYSGNTFTAGFINWCLFELQTYNKKIHLSTKYNTKRLWYRVSNENQADNFSSSKTGNGIGMFVINLFCGL